MSNDPRVTYLGQLLDVLPAYPLIDLLVLSSYREGFGNVLIEAAAMEIPVVAPEIPGCRDAVADGTNGTLFAKGDRQDLVQSIERYLTDPDLLAAHGRAGRAMVQERFRQAPLWQALQSLYAEA